MAESDIRGNTPQSDDGTFEEKYDDDEVLRVLVDAHPEPLTGTEIAERCKFSRGTAHNRLHGLVDDTDGLKTKKVGARARIWWVNLGELKGPISKLRTLRRSHLISVATKFDPPFNQTHADNSELVEYLLEQDFDRLSEIIDEVVEDDS